ncbi:hypothetical protein [Synechococcus sp. 'PEA 65AY6A-5F PE A']|jgi:hypothetical protein|uniref:hypothetical protein n=1 Tax=Synechococcus sp. 'PEA 65AY6A-5F PE A' TaxID=1504259 RepID=UPI0039C34E02
MSDPNQEIKDLILALDKKLEGIDRKLEIQVTEIKSEIRLVKTDLEAKIDLTRNDLESKIQGARNELEAKIDLSRSSLEVKIAELSGKMDGYSKRLDQQEFISRGAIVALVVGVASGFIKYLFFSN